MLAAASHVEHLGPLYDEAKDRFFSELDVMLFPTKYINEAEPLVIHEALRAGVFTIACDRGAIAEILDNGAGLALPEHEFVVSAARWLARARHEPASLGDTRRSCREQALSIQKHAAIELEHLLQAMSTVQPTAGV
jgi:glycosyltransferase involved in cell wall biosynthesis